MSRYADIAARIEGVGELRNIIGALRSLSGMRMQEALRALSGVRRYTEMLGVAVADARLLLADEVNVATADQPRALVLCTAEHGFVGAFNERLLDAVHARLRQGDLLFVLGDRGAALAVERGYRLAWSHAMATRSASAPQVVHALSTELFRRLARGEAASVEVIYARCQQGGPAVIERRSLLPLDPAVLASAQAKQPPLHNLEPRALHDRLLHDYVFAQLTDAAIESIASENAARFTAMQSAHENVSRRLEELRRDAHQARQAEITNEIIEVITAERALRLARGEA